MSRIYCKAFTSKSAFTLFFFFLSLFIFNNSAYSDNSTKIIGHYYVAKNKEHTQYTDKVQWEVTSTGEWTKFLVNLKSMPQDLEKNNPMGLRQPEIVHFNVMNGDKKSGHDIFISKAGIQQFSRMPLDRYYFPSPDFKEFLQTELSLNPGYDKTNSEADINEPGIVVIYRGSAQLANPHWTIKLTDKGVMQRYITYISGLNYSQHTKDVMLSKNDALYETENTFMLYLNYPGAPHHYLVVGTDGSVRGTRIENRYFYYKDVVGYFSMFKRQAEDNLRATKMEEKAPEEIRRKEVQRGTLF